MPSLSIIMPVLDEAPGIAEALASLQGLRSHGVELIVVDGGSRDRTMELARPLADRVIAAPRGRGAQINVGAALATGVVLLFLHADTRLPPGASSLVVEGLRRSGCVWGRFDVRIEGDSALLGVVAWLMNKRSRLTGIATGDQAMFVRRETFAAVGGFPDLPLMEDVALSQKLKRISRPVCLAARAVTSGRRWQRHGVIRTIVLMWWLRLRYCLGAKPEVLARRYGYAPRDT